jgi:dTDP-4-amino-4,6-dideoxygalactose transaminase
VVQTQKRDELRDYLARTRVSTGIHYPVPLHLQKAYAHLGYAEGSFPVTEKAASEILSLPMFPQLGHEDQRHVAAKTCEFFEATAAPEAALRAVAANVS